MVSRLVGFPSAAWGTMSGMRHDEWNRRCNERTPGSMSEEGQMATGTPGTQSMGEHSRGEQSDLSLFEAVISGRTRDLGGVSVRRILPSSRRRMVGPFILLDHLGPVALTPGRGIDVPPHPHIGLATVTYLFEGELIHRDSLGSVQAIRPGAVNWMSAGRGIVHSERSSPEDRALGPRLHGLQSWVVLPTEAAEGEPGFSHHPAESLPTIERDGAAARLIAGSAFDRHAPVETRSPLFYMDAIVDAGAVVPLPDEYAERAIYVVAGSLDGGDAPIGEGTLAVVRHGGDIDIRALTRSRLMVLGGAPLPGSWHIWWNFVAGSSQRIEQAKDDWKSGRFPPVPDEHGAIPLPEA